MVYECNECTMPIQPGDTFYRIPKLGILCNDCVAGWEEEVPEE